MKTISRADQRQVAVLAAVVYFIQGALGISAVAAPVFLRRLGWSVGDIAVISSLGSLPWVFKILYGFLSDSFPVFRHRRKPYLFFYLFCSVAGWLALALRASDKGSILTALFIANMGFAGADTITDGLIVEHSQGGWSGIFQSIAWGFRSLGSVLTGMLGGWLMLKLDPHQIFLLTAGLPLLAIPSLTMLREPRTALRLSKDELMAQGLAVKKFCLMRQTLWFVLFLALGAASSLFGTPFFFYMKEKLFFQDDYLGFLVSLGWAGAALGSVAFGLWMKKIPMRQLFFAVVIVNVINILSTYAVVGVFSAAWLVFLGGVAAGIVLLPLMTGAAVMTAASGVEGTLFALLMGVFNLAQIGWGILGGKWLPVLGLWGLIGLSAVLQAAAYGMITAMPKDFFRHFENKAE